MRVPGALSNRLISIGDLQHGRFDRAYCGTPKSATRILTNEIPHSQHHYDNRASKSQQERNPERVRRVCALPKQIPDAHEKGPASHACKTKAQQRRVDLLGSEVVPSRQDRGTQCGAHPHENGRYDRKGQ